MTLHEITPGGANPSDFIQGLGICGEEIYNRKYRMDFERRFRGKFVAINTETEDAYVGDTAEDASAKAHAAHPRSINYLIHIGSDSLSLR